jgi:hypothetical protein
MTPKNLFEINWPLPIEKPDLNLYLYHLNPNFILNGLYCINVLQILDLLGHGIPIATLKNWIEIDHSVKGQIPK